MADVGRLVFSAHRNDSLEAARRTFELHGITIIGDVFSPAEIRKWREGVLSRLPLFEQTRPRRGALANFLARPDFGFMKGLDQHPTLLGVLRHIVFPGKPFRFVSHNDIGVDLIVKWHKDRLNQEYAVFQQRPLWSDGGLDGHRIIKAAIYLQDHTTDNQSLVAVPGSWREPSLRLSPSTVTLHPPLGSAVIFEQRNTHRGAHSAMYGAGNVLSGQRILVSLGFGLDGNAWTDEFETGTRARQGDQCRLSFGPRAYCTPAITRPTPRRSNSTRKG